MVNGENADTLIVTARTKGGQRDAAGIGVFLVPANAKGVTRKGYPTQDGLHAADITLTGVEVGADAALGDGENALPLIERVVDEARTALCAESVGLMDEVAEDHRRILEDAKTVRRADRLLPDPAAPRRRHVRGAGAGPLDVDVRDHGGRFRGCQGARQRGCRRKGADRQVGKFVGQQSIQLHGGIGMTMEAKIGHYFKRLTMIENSFGDTDYHLRRVSESGGLV